MALSQSSKKDKLLGRSVPIADFLSLDNNDDIRKMLDKYGNNNETIMFSSKVIKINKNSKEQERVMLVTTKAVYNLKINDFKKPLRRVIIDSIVAVTISTKSDELVLHIPDEYDYRYKTNKKERIAKILVDICKTKLKKKINITKLDIVSLQSVTLTKEISKYQTDEQKELRKQQLQETFENKEDKVVPNDFEPIKNISSYKGQYGKVKAVTKKDTKQKFWMKIIKKSDIKQFNSVEINRKILYSLQHPFLFSLRYAIQTEQKLYFIMEYPQGGTLKQILVIKNKFNEKQSQFIVAECIEAIAHLHIKDLIYRDLKTENVIMLPSGHIKIADYGLTKDTQYYINDESKGNYNDNNNEFEFLKKSLNPEYIPPEILKNINYTKDMDWWCIGILFYNLLYGISPFYATEINDIYKNILNNNVSFLDDNKSNNDDDEETKYNDNNDNIGYNVSKNAKEFIKKLLQKDYTERLGNGPNDVLHIKRHTYFDEYPWQKLIDKEIEPPFIPPNDDN